MIISKELLSEILGNNIIKIYDNETKIEVGDYTLSDFDIAYKYEYNGFYYEDYINIYLLAHLCKEWAWNLGFYYWLENNVLYIKILHSCKVDWSIDIGIFKKPFDVNIDFKAINWILKNKELLKDN